MKKTAFIHCTLLDGKENMIPQENMTVVVDGDKIISVEKDALAPSDAKQVVNLSGKYLLPGLINLHVHLPGNGYPKKKKTDPVKAATFILKNSFTRMIGRKLCEKYAKVELLSGTTTLRTVGGLGNIDSLIAKKAVSGKIKAPRILSSNTAISVKGGHMTGSVAVAATSEEDCKKLVSEAVQGGADWIKIMITGGVLDAVVKGEPGVVRMSPSFVKACTEEAHRLGLKVAAHVESPAGVKIALENGVDTVEHGAKPDAEIIALYKKTGACLVATFSPAVPFVYLDPKLLNIDETARYNAKVVFDGITESAKAAIENNIPLGLGTDTACPFVSHYDMWRELEYFHKFTGVDRTFALYTATKRNAEIAGIGDQTGTIEEGKSADFIICKDNPLDGFSTLKECEMVVCMGRMYKKPKIKKNPLVECELDKILL